MKTEDFNRQLELIKDTIILSIKMQMNKICNVFLDDEVREINFNETNLGYCPIYNYSDEDFNTTTVDEVSLDENEKLSFKFSSEIQEQKIGTEKDLNIEQALSILKTIEDIEPIK